MPLHPAAPDVPNAWNPLYWLRGLTGNEFVRVPVRVSFANSAVYESELVRHTIDYSIARPDQEMDLEPVSILEALRADDGAELVAAGEGTLVEAAFPPSDIRPLVAGTMLEHCPE